MDVGKYLAEATKTLTAAGVETARLDVLVLIEDTLGKDRATLLAHPEMIIPSSELVELNNYITHRSKHTPLAYIRGKVMFYGREFIVNTNVLVPRSETETIIDLLKITPLPSDPHIADIGTGSGCIGITAGLEIPGSKVDVYDIDSDALAIAIQNVQKHHLMIQAHQQDLLTNCTEQFDAVLANLPYVPNNYPINQAATFEPELALFSGQDGLDHYRTFWKQLQTMSTPSKPKYVFTESMPEQHADNARLAKAAGYAQDAKQDFIQRFILLSATEE